jgi:hypothetical protein
MYVRLRFLAAVNGYIIFIQRSSIIEWRRDPPHHKIGRTESKYLGKCFHVLIDNERLALSIRTYDS